MCVCVCVCAYTVQKFYIGKLTVYEMCFFLKKKYLLLIKAALI